MSIIAEAIDLSRCFFDRLGQDAFNDDDIGRWRAMRDATISNSRSARLDLETTSVLATVTGNVIATAAALDRLQQASQHHLVSLSDDLERLLISEHHTKRGMDSIMDVIDNRTVKRSRRSRIAQCAPRLSALHQSPVGDDPVRQFFIDNIACPYPTASQKDLLCKKAKCSRRKLESDLTNWRRRSEWTDMMNVYCGGDRGAMKVMIEDIQAGVEVGDEIMGRYERMKGYLEKKDEQAGEWVYELADMVRSGEIGPLSNVELRSVKVVEVDVDSDELERFDDSSDADADAEGESDNAPSPSSDLDSSECITVAMPSTTVQYPTPSTSSASDSSISPISSTHSTATALTVPVTKSTIGRGAWKTNFDQDSSPFTTKALSTRSSHSSLSAVSNVAQSKSRSTSGSHSLRSVSGSSTSSTSQAFAIDPRLHFLKRSSDTFPPAQAQGQGRSSRSRVEEILSEEPAPWVEGHAPGQAFHIGADPSTSMALPVPMTWMPYEAVESPAPMPGYNGDLTPYLMAPDAWSTSTAFTYLPHVTQPALGSFEMPPEYDFTYQTSVATTSST